MKFQVNLKNDMVFGKILKNTELKHYLVLPVLVLFNFVLQLYVAENYENIGPATTPDSLHYLTLAKEFPIVNDTTFPTLYPLFIKLINLFVNNYLISSKVFGILAIIFAYCFTIYKDFFWKQIWVVLSTVSFIESNFYTWSETLFVPLLIILAYFSFQYLRTNEKDKNYIWKFSIILILLFSTKYSALFLIIAIYFFVIMVYFNTKTKLGSLLIANVITSIFILLNLVENYHLSGYYTGPRVNTAEVMDTLNIKLSLYSIIYNLNPIINSRLIYGYKINYLILFFGTIALYIPILIRLKRLKQIKIFSCFLLICGLFFLLLTLLSYFITKIDDLNARLLLPFIFFIFLFLLTLEEFKSYKKIYLISYASLIVCISDKIFILYCS